MRRCALIRRCVARAKSILEGGGLGVQTMAWSRNGKVLVAVVDTPNGTSFRDQI
jgi:hypothetical protein